MNAALMYRSFMLDLACGRFNFNEDRFHALLASDAYRSDIEHSRRSDIEHELPPGGGYSTGGYPISTRASLVGTSLQLDIGELDLHDVYIAARHLILYKHRGGDPSHDELVYDHDFGRTVEASMSGHFRVTESQIVIFGPG